MIDKQKTLIADQSLIRINRKLEESMVGISLGDWDNWFNLLYKRISNKIGQVSCSFPLNFIQLIELVKGVK